MDVSLMSARKWIKTCSPDILDVDCIPLFGKSPPFPLQELKEKLGFFFGSDLLLNLGEWSWRTQEEHLTKLPVERLVLKLALPGLEGNAWWVISRAEFLHLLRKLLRGEELPEPLEEGIIQFVCLRLLDLLHETPFASHHQIVIDGYELDTSSQLLGAEISCSIDQLATSSMLLVSSSLVSAWRASFEDVDLEASSPQLAVTACVHLELDRLLLTRDEWSAVSSGDFIPLSRASVQLDAGKAKVFLTVDGQTLFRARVKPGSIKILEFPFIQGAEESMSNESMDEETIAEDEENVTEELTEEFSSDEEQAQPREDVASVGGEPGERPASEPERLGKRSFTSPSSIPMEIRVEIGRLKLPVQELLQLTPGNVLELNVSVNDPVELLVNGRCIAVGELIEIGERIGVRILECAQTPA